MSFSKQSYVRLPQYPRGCFANFHNPHEHKRRNTAGKKRDWLFYAQVPLPQAEGVAVARTWSSMTSHKPSVARRRNSSPRSTLSDTTSGVAINPGDFLSYRPQTFGGNQRNHKQAWRSAETARHSDSSALIFDSRIATTACGSGTSPVLRSAHTREKTSCRPLRRFGMTVLRLSQCKGRQENKKLPCAERRRKTERSPECR